MKKTSPPTCRARAATSKFRFAGLGILLALAVNAEAATSLNLDLSFDQASIPGSVGGSGIPGTATGTFTLTGGFVATSTGDVYGGGYLFGVSWSHLLSCPLPDNTYLEFSMVPASGTVTYNGGPWNGQLFCFPGQWKRCRPDWQTSSPFLGWNIHGE